MNQSVIKNIARILFGLTLCLASFSEVKANHFAGADLFYHHLGGLRYRVTVRWYRDCSGAAFLDSTIHWSDGRCQPAVGTVIARSTNYPGDIQEIFSSRYNPTYKCSSAMDPNFPSRPANFIAVEYLATITLPRRSRNWVFWVEGSSRPSVNNVSNANMLYSDAFLNNLDFDGNNSPYFSSSDVPLPYLSFGQPFTYYFNTLEADGDSLIYSMESPLMGCNGSGMTLGIYDNYSGSRLADTLRGPNCNAIIPSGIFSAKFPIASFVLDQTANGSCSSRKFFAFDSRNGAIMFIPTNYTPNSNPADPVNKHIVVIRITEKRRNSLGVWRTVGEVQRDIFVTIVEPAYVPPLPLLTITTTGTSAYTSNKDSSQLAIQVKAGMLTQARLDFSDPTRANPSLINVSYQNTGTMGRSLIPSAIGSFSVSQNNSLTPIADLSITPTLADVGKEFKIYLKVENDDAPIKRYRRMTLKLKVLDPNVVALPNAINSSFTAYPNPASGSKINLKLNNMGIANLSIVSAVGNLVFQQPIDTTLENVEVDLKSKLASGVYYVNLSSGQSNKTIRLVVE